MVYTRALRASVSNDMRVRLSPAALLSFMINYRGVAQLVARAVWDREVAGSNPVSPTKNNIMLALPILRHKVVLTWREVRAWYQF